MKVDLGDFIDCVTGLNPHEGLETKQNMSADSGIFATEKDCSDNAADVPGNYNQNKITEWPGELCYFDFLPEHGRECGCEDNCDH